MQRIILQGLSVFLIILMCLVGCSSPTDYEIGSQVLINVPFLHVQGGECFQGSAAMIGSTLRGVTPTQAMLDQQNAFLGHDGAITIAEKLSLLRDFWQFDFRVDHSGIGEMYHYLSQGKYLIAIVDGWGHNQHATVVIGVDVYHVYIVDPVGGYRYYTHAAWRELHQDSRGQVFVIQGFRE